MKSVLLVCAGNICRSPIAESLFRQKLDASWKIDSAGIVGLPAHPADDMAIASIDELKDAPLTGDYDGLDIEALSKMMKAHRSKRITDDIMRQFELILVMTASQVLDAENRWPFAKGKIFKIGHWTGHDVPDPYKKDKLAFIQTRDLIVEGASTWLKRL